MKVQVTGLLRSNHTPLPHTYQPAVHTSFAFHEYLAFLRKHLDDNWGTDRGITINFWGVALLTDIAITQP